ncbi:MAG: hypothetical protein U0R44_04805 [Candidatus Micrarchaeia archaeon]
MTNSRLNSQGSQYTARERARAFLRGLPELEPLVNIAREGLRKEGLDTDQRVGYVLRIAGSKSSTCGEIISLISHLYRSSGKQDTSGDPYRSSGASRGIHPLVQDRLCGLFRARYDEAMASLLGAGQGETDQENASHLVQARIRSRMDKARMAYDLLKSGAVDSPQARRHLAAVFCDAGKDIMAGNLFSNADSAYLLDAIIHEFRGESLRGIIPFGISPYEADRILTSVSVSLCGADMSPLSGRP